MSYLDEIDDPRKPSNGTLHDFREILVILIAAVLSDCDTVEDITFWARTKEAWLRRFLVLKNGIPSEETFLRILRALDPKQFEDVFRRWVGGVVGALSNDAGLAGTIAIAGRVGAHCGYGMRRGTLVFAGPPPAVPPTFVATHQDIVVFWTLLRRSLAYHGGRFAALPARAPSRLVGDLAVDGKGEWLLPG